MSAATPAEIWVWFCVIHTRTSNSYHIWPTSHGPFTDCVMERRRLVDPSALVVEKDAAGHWPAEIIEQARKILYTEQWAERWIEALFDALAEARREAST